jgi:hypothetical protein
LIVRLLMLEEVAVVTAQVTRIRHVNRGNGIVRNALHGKLGELIKLGYFSGHRFES